MQKLNKAINADASGCFKSIAMHPAICMYDDQAFDDMSEESEKKLIIIKKSLRPVSSQGMVEQAKKMVN